MDREVWRAAPTIRPIQAAGEAMRAAREAACYGLARTRPELSAHRTVTPPQILWGGLMIVGIAGAAVLWPAASGAFWHACALVAFSAAILFRAAAAIASLNPPPAPPAWTGPLPRYSLLVPLFREANVAADLIAALSRLDYPKDRLEILLLLEADDADTIAAIAAAMPAHPSPFRIVLIPFSHPRTKPKALNFALPFCAGEFIAVYDAEDRPHPQQLHAALAAFQAGAADLACVQAPLLTDNAHASWIAGQFSLEYAIHFTQVIALFARLRLPLPLGGTSNHFRKWALVAAGGWDPYNVTEDADLGYRLARAGYRIGAIAPPTFEEAPARLSGWTRQRSRWIKGHLQTWLLLMRAPGRTMAEMGVIGFWAMQLGLAGGLLAAFLHAPMLALLLLSPLLPGAQLDPIDWALAAAGFFAAWSCALCAAYRCQDPGLVRHALTMPVYWPLTFLPGLIALIELVARPHYWAKTDHALTARTAPAHAGRPHP